MSRTPELHDRFADWLAARVSGADDDPPRDLALHAAGCERCLRSATAIDTLDRIDVGLAAPPPLRAEPVRRGSIRRAQVARYAVAGAALVLLAGSVAIGSSWLGERRSTESSEVRGSPPEGVLAGVPSPTLRVRVSPTPTTKPSERPSGSAEPSESPSEDGPAPSFATPQPTSQPFPPPAPTAAPTFTAQPTPTVAPTPLPTPTPTPEPTPSPTPTPTPEPTPAPECSNGVDDDGDTLIDFGIGGDPGCTSPDDPSEEELAP
jgi:hypothetical protein